MWPVAVLALGGASVGTRVWRRRGQIYVSAVVKASFALCADGAMRRVASDPLYVDEQPEPKGQGLATGGDMAPYLAQTDFWMVGHAQGVLSPGDGSLHVHVGIVRDGALIYEKYLPLASDLRVGDAGPFYLGGWGPLSRHWPVRSRFLGAFPRALLEGAFLDLPDAFDLAYFQSSPLDQRLPPLRGDDWILLQNIFPERNCLKTRLPAAMGKAKIVGQGSAFARGYPIRMGLDSLQIDTDRRVASLLWRGYFPVSSMGLLPSLRVVGGVEMPGHPLEWERPAGELIPPKPILPPPPEDQAISSDNPLENTIFIDAGEAHRLSVPTPPPSRNPAAHASKIPSTLPPPRGASPFPIRKAELIPIAPMPPVPTLADTSEEESPLAGTMTLPEDEALRLAGRKTMPFVEQGGEDKAQGPHAHSLTALPFVKVEKAAIEAQPEPVGEGAVLEEQAPILDIHQVSQSEAPAPLPPKPVLQVSLDATEEMSLGEIFLALMRESGAEVVSV